MIAAGKAFRTFSAWSLSVFADGCRHLSFAGGGINVRPSCLLLISLARPRSIYCPSRIFHAVIPFHFFLVIAHADILFLCFRQVSVCSFGLFNIVFSQE
ncbi:hypothetical protein C8R44DRAFT_810810, partial [Mycena epipterygia]